MIVLKAFSWMLFCIMETFCYGLFSLFMGDRGKFISLQLCLLSPSTPTLVIKVLGGEYEYNLFASVTKSSCPSHFFLCSFSSPRKTQPISQVLHTRDRLGEQKGGIRWKRRHACNPGVLSWWCVLIGDHHDLFTPCLFPLSSMTQRIPTQCFSYEINTSSHIQGKERRLVGTRLVKLKKMKKKWRKRSPSLPCLSQDKSRKVESGHDGDLDITHGLSHTRAGSMKPEGNQQTEGTVIL